jgi:hypothetical protein
MSAACTRESRRTATVSAACSTRAKRSPDQLAEQALERVVERTNFEQADRRVAREPRQRGGQLTRTRGLDDETVSYLVECHSTYRSPARASCVGACRSRTRRSIGTAPRPIPPDRECPTRAAGPRVRATRSAHRTSQRRRTRSDRAAGSRAPACTPAVTGHRSDRERHRGRTPRPDPWWDVRARAGGGRSSSCPRRWRRPDRLALAVPPGSGRRARSYRIALRQSVEAEKG